MAVKLKYKFRYYFEDNKKSLAVFYGNFRHKTKKQVNNIGAFTLALNRLCKYHYIRIFQKSVMALVWSERSGHTGPAKKHQKCAPLRKILLCNFFIVAP